ncbi:hypothetical protein HYC85_023588 [Camellia sinensis]|uniref:Thaumatin-like protein n=1 Tax=Camellia sinensis TaxID=4442 RepID=A0A7J7GF05_CAMSI|nr:hypothetical protein HYC85_023588 [Camellia sinensis]
MFTITSPWMFLMFFLVKSFPTNSFASTFTVINNCPQTIWPGTLVGSRTPQLLTIGISTFLGWSGRIWARIGCKFDESRVGTCKMGDYGRRLECDGVGVALPVSLFKITMGTGAIEKDFYDVSIVDGYSLPLIAAPQGVFGVCNALDVFKTSTKIIVARSNASSLMGMNLMPPTTITVINKNFVGCPKELQVVNRDNGEVGVVGCRSACDAFGLDQYCYSGEFANTTTCRPTSYSTIFKTSYLRAYSYAFDDGTNCRHPIFDRHLDSGVID